MTLIRMKSKEELLELFKKEGYTEDSECDSYYYKYDTFTFEMFDVCDRTIFADIDNSGEYDYIIGIENETFGVKKEWCVEITEQHIKEKVSNVISKISDGAIQSLIRRTIFECSTVDWEFAYRLILIYMPEEK